MRSLPPQKLITCVLPHGIALDLLKSLKEEKGIIEASVNNARGMGHLTPLHHRRIGAESEREIVNVVVPADRADELFEFIYFEAHIDRPHGGIIFLAPLGAATPFVLPELPEER